MPFTGYTHLQENKKHCLNMARIFLLSMVSITFLFCPVIGAHDLSETQNSVFGVDLYGSRSDLKLSGLFSPVPSNESTMKFFYSSQTSDIVLLTGGDLMIMPRSMTGPDTGKDVIFLRFEGHDSRIVPHGDQEYSGRANYFIGNNSSEWRTDIPLYRSVVYPDIYPGISLVYSDKEGQLKSEFIIAPDSDPKRISYVYDGCNSVGIDESGALVILTKNGGQLIESRPEAYQNIGGIKTRIPVTFNLSDDFHVGFTLGRYNANYPVIIDPEIITSTYLGGEVEDVGTAITVDNKGIIYIVGYTHSWNFPITQNAFNTTAASYHDIFVTAYSKDGRDVLFSTLLGGAANDYARAVTVDENGTIFITGSTESTDFPVKNAFQSKIQGKYDAFITALSPGGTDIAFSSYIGGNDIDDAFGIALGKTDNRIYLTGTTQSPDFPTINAYQAKKAGQYDLFLTIIDGSGKNLTASTFFGGRQDDYGRAIALDDDGNIYIGGYTYSSKSRDFPIKNALFGPHPMTYDAFVCKFRHDAGDLIYSTYLGGTLGDRISAIAVDRKNQLYVTGYTFADDFPVTSDAFQRKYGGNLLADAFVVGLAPDGQSLVGSTYLGGSADDMGYGITIGNDGTIFVTGGTMSQNFPVRRSWQQTLKGSMNAFVTGIDPSCNRLIFSSYLGGDGTDHGNSITHDSKNLLYITGTTGSEEFPVIHPVQGTYGGDDDAFLTIVSPDSVSFRNPVVIIPPVPSLVIATEK